MLTFNLQKLLFRQVVILAISNMSCMPNTFVTQMQKMWRRGEQTQEQERLLVKKKVNIELMRDIKRIIWGEGVGEKSVAERVNMVREILAHNLDKIDINDQDSKGDTMLHYAIEAGSPSLVQVFLSQGANPNLTNQIGWAPLSLALKMAIRGIRQKVHQAEYTHCYESLHSVGIRDYDAYKVIKQLLEHKTDIEAVYDPSVFDPEAKKHRYLKYFKKKKFRESIQSILDDYEANKEDKGQPLYRKYIKLLAQQVQTDLAYLYSPDLSSPSYPWGWSMGNIRSAF